MDGARGALLGQEQLEQGSQSWFQVFTPVALWGGGEKRGWEGRIKEGKGGEQEEGKRYSYYLTHTVSSVQWNSTYMSW